MLHATLSLLLAATPGPDDVHDEALRALHLANVDVQRLELPDTVEAGVFVEVDLEGLRFTLDLRPHSLRAPGYQLLADVGGVLTAIDPEPERTLRGPVVEDPGSVVAAGLLDDGLYAKILLSSGELYWIQPLARFVPSASVGQHAIYHQADILPSTHRCGFERFADEPGFEPPPVTGPADAGFLYTCELAIDADYPYFQDYGSVSAVEARTSTVINAMNTQYEDEVRITHVITTTIVRTTPGTYTTNVPGSLLSQVRSEWVANQSHIARDTVQMFTGRNLQGGVIGIAHGNGICSIGTGYDLVQSDFSGNFACTTDLSAHELGHTWGAGHCTCNGYTMNPTITCANRFHDELSELEIEDFRDTRTCIDPGFSGDVLFVENFESSNFTKHNWTISDPTRCKVKKNAAFEGQYGAKLKKGGQGTAACTVGTLETWIEAPPIDTTGYATVRVLMYAHVRNNDLGCENLDLQWWDGASWQSVDIVEAHAWDAYEIPLPAGAAGNPALRLRLITNCKGQAERGEVDNFCVVGE